MIDWLYVARSALWILGLSVALAGFSHASWWGSQHGLPLSAALDRPRFTIPFSVGMMLFCAGLAWAAPPLWARGLWLVLAAAFAYQLVRARRSPSNK